MSKPELVIFDLAGTTIDDNHDVHRVLQAVFKKINIHVSLEEANAVMGIPKPVAIKILLEGHGHFEITEELVKGIHEDFVAMMIEFYKLDPSIREKSGASDVFRKLKDQGIKVAVDTGFDRPIADVLLQRMGWIKNGLLDASVTSDEVRHGRPFPDMIFKAMDLTRVASSSSVMKVGDTISDLEEGASAGCQWIVGITSGAYTREQLSRGPYTHLIHQLEDLIPIFQDESVGSYQARVSGGAEE